MSYYRNIHKSDGKLRERVRRGASVSLVTEEDVSSLIVGVGKWWCMHVMKN